MYIGSSVDITGRYTFHRFMLRRGLHKTKALQELWTRDGEAAFQFKTLDRCIKADLLRLEQVWLDQTPDRLNTSAYAVTGHGGQPSEAKKAAARKRQPWLDARGSDGRFPQCR